MDLTYKEETLLEVLFEERLLHNWNICDKYPSGTEEYEKATDECSVLKHLAPKLGISYSAYIASRF